MQVHPVGNVNPVAHATGGSDSKLAAPVQAQAPKTDSVVLSEKAKDLAALKAGKGNQEEMSESISSKIREGDGD